ncbi:MAG TPA: hypothetical protein VFM97_00230 [Gammaproteobacteria bacterium]|nr:hypothetical protein [Gammaproteobacteria bacterium]
MRVLFFKSYVRAHKRRLGNGRVILVGSYHNKVSPRPKHKPAEKDEKTGDLFEDDREREPPRRTPFRDARALAAREAGPIEQRADGGWNFGLWDPESGEWEYAEEAYPSRRAAETDRSAFIAERTREIQSSNDTPSAPMPLADWQARRDAESLAEQKRMIASDKAAATRERRERQLAALGPGWQRHKVDGGRTGYLRKDRVEGADGRQHRLFALVVPSRTVEGNFYVGFWRDDRPRGNFNTPDTIEDAKQMADDWLAAEAALIQQPEEPETPRSAQG